MAYLQQNSQSYRPGLWTLFGLMVVGAWIAARLPEPYSMAVIMAIMGFVFASPWWSTADPTPAPSLRLRLAMAGVFVVVALLLNIVWHRYLLYGGVSVALGVAVLLAARKRNRQQQH